MATEVEQVIIKSTVQNSFCWRIWHSFNYLLGGITFFIGSALYYPYFTDCMDNFNVAGWLYTIGSAGFLLADLTEWNHFRKGCFPCQNNSQLSLSENFSNKQLGLNFFASAIGSALYLWGSIYFIPSLNKLAQGESLFIIGSTFIYASQGWKLWRTAIGGEKTLFQNINEDISGFLVDLFAGVGGIFYFFGTFIFRKSQEQPDYYLSAVHLFVLGGASFLISGIFILKRYFLQAQKVNQIVGSQLEEVK